MVKLHHLFQGFLDLFVACCLCLTLCLPVKIRKSFIRWTAPLTYNLIIRMLIPASTREQQTQPLWLQPLQADSTALIIAFGGNNQTIEELIPLLQGMTLHNTEPFGLSAIPTLLVPLAHAYSQKEYIEQIDRWIAQYTHTVIPNNITQIQAIGHSLGGAILVQTAPFLQARFPNAQVFLTLDRTFTTLSAAAKGRYGFGGILLEHTLGLLWKFDSVSQLRKLAGRPNIALTVIQVDPDPILGRALLSRAMRDLPRKDWMIYHLKRSHTHNCHDIPIRDLGL